jgi:hypothetical protein
VIQKEQPRVLHWVKRTAADDGAQGDTVGVAHCDVLGDADRTATDDALADADERPKVMYQVM